MLDLSIPVGAECGDVACERAALMDPVLDVACERAALKHPVLDDCVSEPIMDPVLDVCERESLSWTPSLMFVRAYHEPSP